MLYLYIYVCVPRFSTVRFIICRKKLKNEGTYVVTTAAEFNSVLCKREQTMRCWLGEFVFQRLPLQCP